MDARASVVQRLGKESGEGHVAVSSGGDARVSSSPWACAGFTISLSPLLPLRR